MQRLNDATLSDFLGDPGLAVVMFGAPEGEATMAQAVEFAHAWLECRDEASFGYVDAFESVAAARAYAVRVLPTTIIARRGEILAWIEGRHAGARVIEAVRDGARARVAA
jgi:hypothetical protein